MAGPVPINGIHNSTVRAGSAFIVGDGGAFWLTTCAHVITGTDSVPALHSHFLGGVIKVLAPEIVLPLYQLGAARFTLVTNSTTGMISDAMAIRLTPEEVEVLHAVGHYHLESISEVAVGDTVTMFGYPGLKLDPIPCSSMSAEVTEHAGGNFKLSAPGAKGYSGGPVMRDGSVVGIAQGDVGDEHHMTNSLAESLALLKPRLFV